MNTINLTSIRGWQSLEENQQNAVIEETRKIEELRLDEAKSRIGIGEHLVKVKRNFRKKSIG